MKYILLSSLFIWLNINNCFATIVNLSSFNIKPGLNTNNTDGFLKLNKWLTGKKDIIINFQKGVYYVGKQTPSTTSVTENIDNIFSLVNCSNITINGNGAILKFTDKLMYGSFDAITKKPLTHTTAFAIGKNAAYPGNCIMISNSTNIVINNLNLDGNIQNMIIGGIYGDRGIQLWHRGIYILNSKNIKLTNIYVHHFGLDGIEVSSTIKEKIASPEYQVILKRIKSVYNGRNALSWTGTSGLYAENSDFSYSGKSKVASSPCAGFDIEPEAGTCSNGYFYKCKFENNTSHGIISDFNGNPTDKITFNSCTIGGNKSPAIWPHNGNITIDKSIIYGQIVSPAGNSPSSRLLIKNCQILDFIPNTNIKATNSYVLIDAGGFQKNYEFSGCRFEVKYLKFCYLESQTTNPNEMPVFKNNTVIFNYDTFENKDFIAVFRGCILENNEFQIKINKVPEGGLYLLTGHGTKSKSLNIITGKNSNVGWNSPGGPKTLSEQ